MTQEYVLLDLGTLIPWTALQNPANYSPLGSLLGYFFHYFKYYLVEILVSSCYLLPLHLIVDAQNLFQDQSNQSDSLTAYLVDYTQANCRRLSSYKYQIMDWKRCFEESLPFASPVADFANRLLRGDGMNKSGDQGLLVRTIDK